MLDRHAFGDDDQDRFARLSGDWNPMHVDPVAARREMFGERVVHGLHGLLRALDAYLAARGGATTLRRVRARFKGPIPLGAPAETRLVDDGAERARLRIACGDRVATDLELGLAAAAGPRGGPTPPDAAGTGRSAPAPLAFGDLEGRRGELPLALDREAARVAFPRVAAALSAATLAELLAVTRLVGMVCPGLRSILAGLEVEVAAEPGDARALAWEVVEVDPRFASVRIRIAGPTLSGVVDAFHRPEPQPQPAMAGRRESGRAGRLPRHGARRGRIARARRGDREDPRRGRRASHRHLPRRPRRRRARRGRDRRERPTRRVLPLDVAAPGDAAALLERDGVRPDSVYYFASPRIFVARGAAFDPSLFDSFAKCYVTDFAATVAACRRLQPGPLAVFYPSSVAIDERVKTLAEYAAAKAAGEDLCAHLARFDAKLRVVVRRLPRIATDQTLTLVPHPAADALLAMLDVVRATSGAR